MSTIALALVALATSAAVFGTVGQAAATEQEVVQSVDAAGPRLVTVSITEPSPGLSADALERIRRLNGVSWVLALGEAHDVRAVGGTRANVASRQLLSDLPSLVQIEVGRSPAPGEAIVSETAQQRLRMLLPSGGLRTDGASYSVVGGFSSSGALKDLTRLVLVRPVIGDEGHATLIYVLAEKASQVEGLSKAVVAVAGIPAENVAVRTAPELVQLDHVLSGTVGTLARQLGIGSIAVGMVLCGLTVTLAINARRRDLGRRRALGATRSALVILSIFEAGVPILLGSIVGAIVGTSAIVILVGTPPSVEFVLAATLLIQLASIAASVPASVVAAFRDPLRTLRVP